MSYFLRVIKEKKSDILDLCHCARGTCTGCFKI